MKKSTMIFLVFILVVSLIAGCSSSQISSSDSTVKNNKVEVSDSTQKDNESQESERIDEITFPISPEKITVTMMRSIDPSKEPTLLTTQWFELMEEKTNIHIECIDIP